jgi:3-hydroxyacyl-CoA dehydrogenase
MGGGIAMSFLNAGIPVTLLETHRLKSHEDFILEQPTRPLWA